MKIVELIKQKNARTCWNRPGANNKSRDTGREIVAMRIETSSNEYDYGQIRINPIIQDRVNEMHRRRAEENAERQQRIAMDANRAKMLA